MKITDILEIISCGAFWITKPREIGTSLYPIRVLSIALIVD